jgi:hypothetical protein
MQTLSEMAEIGEHPFCLRSQAQQSFREPFIRSSRSPARRRCHDLPAPCPTSECAESVRSVTPRWAAASSAKVQPKKQVNAACRTVCLSGLFERQQQGQPILRHRRPKYRAGAIHHGGHPTLIN